MPSQKSLLRADVHPTKQHQPSPAPAEEPLLADHDRDVNTPDMLTSSGISPQTLLRLQRQIGNRATIQLMRQQNDEETEGARAVPSFIQSKLGQPAGEAPIQRKVFVKDGVSFRPYKVGGKTPQKVQDMANDGVTRRFKNPQEARDFASGITDNMGFVARDNLWVRLEDRFIVVGEEHGQATNAAPLISAFGTSRYRYEGFSSDAREAAGKPNTGAYKTHSDAQEKVGLKKKGGDENEVGLHAAEDVLPKLARVIPDMAKVAADQIAGKSIGGVDPDLSWSSEYSLAKALTQGFLNSLIYAKSYNFSFYTKHATKMNTSITVMQQAHTADKMPDFRTVPIVPHMTQMAAVFKKKAKAAVGIKKIKNFIPLLDTTNEPQVAHTEQAKRLDYLRDYSMYRTILEAKSTDLLFIIGDAHRQKLLRLLGQQGIPSVFYPDLVKEQKRLDEQAESGFTDTDTALLNELRGLPQATIRTKMANNSDKNFTVTIPAKYAPLALEWQFTNTKDVTLNVPGVTTGKATSSSPKAVLVCKLNGKVTKVTDFSLFTYF